ncbi:MAG: RNA helicase, partial [Muribaculaceae bacterium]|nr:RNA helicase [Muribaculaceae bacterium]
DIFSMIVGSNNMTIPGLVQNIECSLMIKDIKSNPVLEDFNSYWENLLNGTDVDLYPITPQLIDNLYRDKIIGLESTRCARHDGIYKSTDANEERKVKFNAHGLQPLPSGFVPQRKERYVKYKKEQIGEKRELKKMKTPILGRNVLIAEIGGPERWKQVNFPISIFQDFFGARKGDNSYMIEMTNISKKGLAGEPRTTQAVTVKSNNYRFELNCEETSLPYPSAPNRPIGVYIRIGDGEFLYQVVMPDWRIYKTLRNYLYMEAGHGKSNELKRMVVDIEALRALYPELIK